MKAINVARLRRAMACSNQVNALYELVGDEDAPLTIEFAIEHATVFAWDWAAYQFLSYDGCTEYRADCKSFREHYENECDSVRMLDIDSDLRYKMYKPLADHFNRSRAVLFATIYLRG